MRRALRGLLMVGVISCVVAAVGTAALKFDDALGLFDLRADLNAESSYAHRSHTHREWSPAGGEVLETARLRMPGDARYRVVFGTAWDRTQTADFTHQLVYGFLLPRRPTRSESAEWVICYACESAGLGERFEVIAGVQGGPTFGRMRG